MNNMNPIKPDLLPNENGRSLSSFQSNQFGLVVPRDINLEGGKVFTLLPSSLERFLKGLSVHYWFILHSEDINPETGELKTPHYHIVIRSPVFYRSSSLINKFSNGLIIPKNVVSIRKCPVLTSALRYLCHSDDVDKHQYDFGDINTNDLSTLLCAYTLQKEELTSSDLLTLCSLHLSSPQILMVIGLKNYSRFRNTINDLQKYFEIHASDDSSDLFSKSNMKRLSSLIQCLNP